MSWVSLLWKYKEYLAGGLVVLALVIGYVMLRSHWISYGEDLAQVRYEKALAEHNESAQKEIQEVRTQYDSLRAAIRKPTTKGVECVTTFATIGRLRDFEGASNSE